MGIVPSPANVSQDPDSDDTIKIVNPKVKIEMRRAELKRQPPDTFAPRQGNKQ